MEPLKNAYDRAYLEGLAAQLSEAWGELDAAAFVADAFGDGWDELELKGRMRRIAETLDRHLPSDLAAALAILDRVVPRFEGYMAMFFPDLVELRAVREPEATWELAVGALARYTPYSSSEFAVRPLLVHDQERMLAEHLRWTASKDHHVRRLASEGCRPRLPWAMALPALKADPAPLLPILEALRHDESEYVRRSVANNLNDVAKDHPDVVRELAARWLAEARELPWTRDEARATGPVAHRSEDVASPPATPVPRDDDHGPQTASDRRRLVKHACRTLLKAGDPATMRLFGFRDPAELEVRGLVLDTPRLAIGERLTFAFELVTDEPGGLGAVRLEYAVHYCKKNGTSSAKVFRIAEFETDAAVRAVTRRQAFRDLSTRKHHPGDHVVAVLVNGVEKARVTFELTR